MHMKICKNKVFNQSQLAKLKVYGKMNSKNASKEAVDRHEL